MIKSFQTERGWTPCHVPSISSSERKFRVIKCQHSTHNQHFLPTNGRHRERIHEPFTTEVIPLSFTRFAGYLTALNQMLFITRRLRETGLVAAFSNKILGVRTAGIFTQGKLSMPILCQCPCSHYAVTHNVLKSLLPVFLQASGMNTQRYRSARSA
jgi:hypothetical protein